MKRRQGLLALALLGAAPTLVSQEKPIVRGEEGKALEAAVEGAHPDFWGAVLVARADEVLLARGFGFGRGKSESSGAELYFDVGSISKTFTAVAVLCLAQEERLTLDDPLQKWIPNAPSDKGAITLRQLLLHASGFARAAAGWSVEDYDQREDVLTAVLAQPLARAPGSAFEYSNVNYTLLAAVVELAAHEPFEEYVERAVLEPCKLQSTSFAGWTGRKLERKRGTERVARGLRSHVLDYPWGWGKRGITNVVTTVHDLHRFVRALRTGALLDEEHRQVLFEPGPGDYACGLEIMREEDGRLYFGHGGQTDGFGASFAFAREDGTTIIALARDQGTAMAVRQELQRVLSESTRAVDR
jgi:CubicO group peptidase (beta-lactamase class C family)